VNENSHAPVLLEEAIDALAIKKDGFYVDATFGRGSHARAVLQRLDKDGHLLVMDRDPQATEYARKNFGNESRMEIVEAPFSHLQSVLEARGLMQAVDGILFDMGVSSPQLDNPERGFSFRHDGPLDMRMDTTSGTTAQQWLATVDEKELAGVIKKYGEERFAKRIAGAIVRERENDDIDTTDKLAKIINQAVPTRERKKDPATRTFQAIRIFINQELSEIEEVLPQAVSALKPGGRLVVISFHSLEDRIVKHFFRGLAQGPELPPDLPIRASEFESPIKLVGKPVKASAREVSENPRSRSAILRIVERTTTNYVAH